jgi:signal recognition particle GTPase
MSGNESSEASLIRQRKILNAMTEDEMTDPFAHLNGKFFKKNNNSGLKKKQIAMVSETTVQEINAVLGQYEMMRDMQKWIRGKKIAGREMPQSQEELMITFQIERPISKEKKIRMKNKQNMNKKMMWEMIKHGGYSNQRRS